MRDGWRQVTLGEVAAPSTAQVSAAGSALPYIGLEHFDPGSPTIVRLGKADAMGSAAVVVQPGDVLFSKLRPYLNKVAVAGLDAVASTEVLVYRPREKVDLRADYLALMLRDQRAIQYAVDRSAGSRMPRTSGKIMSAFEVVLPPLGEQRRIVDLIAAADNAVEAAEAEASAATSMLDELLSDARTAETRQIGAVASLESGASWGKAAVRDGPGEDTTPVITIANTKPTGAIAGAPTYVTGLPKKTRLLQQGSIIAIRTNGNHQRIGNVYRAQEAEVGAAVSAFQFIVDAIDTQDAGYLYWMMRSPSFQERVSDAASGSTGLGNIAVSKVRTMDVPWPASAAERQTLVSRFEAAHRGGEAARETADALRALRSNLLTVLLSGEHQIPASYDRLLEESA